MRKILIIEDEDAIREDIVEILSHAKFDTINAENGFLGVQLAKQHQPDLIICDIMMPGLDGYEVLEALRQEPTTAIIPFIFLTAKAERADLRRGMNLGADDYLIKPIGQAELLEAIASRLDKQANIESHYNNLIHETQSRIDYLLHYDILTNLPNRLSLRSQLDQVLNQTGNSAQLISFLLVDLDRFNRINDTLGQSFGDSLLKSVVERLSNCLGTGAILARLDADEFAIILTEPNLRGVAEKVAQTILQAISQPFSLDNQDIYLTCSIGITTYAQNKCDMDTLIKQVKVALNHAKRQGGNCYQFYTSHIQADASIKLTLESELHHALERSEFRVYYQPQVNLRTSEIFSAEALIRWYHPKLGLLSPQRFLPLAEESGSIIPIDEWVLKNACLQAKVWQSMLGSLPEMKGKPLLKVAVNLSARQFHQPHLSTTVLNILEETGFDPQCLELELTEGIIVHDLDASIAKLNNLKSLGIQIALDDFGTGYSSLSYLKRFPIDTLKIDRCFIGNLTDDSTNKAIVLSIIRLAHSLNLKVIAEGVETKTELDFLREHNCDEIQGYIFSHPLPTEEFGRLLTMNQYSQV